MTPGDARKLIGGYATGNLSEQERKALFEAALADQDLFDALIQEQHLKEVLDDPRLRRRLLDRLQLRGRRLFTGWHWAMAGGVAAVTIAIAVVVLRTPEIKPRAPALTASRLPAPRPAAEQTLPRPAAPKPADRPTAWPKRAMKTGAVSEVIVPPAAGLAATAAIAGGAPLRYQILRRGADGTFSQVPLDTVFDTGDAVRLRVEPQASGTVSVSDGASVLASASVEANRPYELPADGAITVGSGPGDTRLTLGFLHRAPGRAALMRSDKREVRAETDQAASIAAAREATVVILLHHR